MDRARARARAHDREGFRDLIAYLPIHRYDVPQLPRAFVGGERYARRALVRSYGARRFRHVVYHHPIITSPRPSLVKEREEIWREIKWREALKIKRGRKDG